MGIIEPLPGLAGGEAPVDTDALRSDEARAAFEAQFGSQPWMEDYWALRGEGWSWRQACYMIWASMPRESRTPTTQAELATQVLGLASDRQIRKWRNNNPAIDARIHALQVSALAKARPEIIKALIDSASRPDPRAHADRKMALEMLGDYTDETRVRVNVGEQDLETLPEEDLAALARVPGDGQADGE
jgi:hypothetical protein